LVARSRLDLSTSEMAKISRIVAAKYNNVPMSCPL
jgi:hypothetical protein